MLFYSLLQLQLHRTRKIFTTYLTTTQSQQRKLKVSIVALLKFARICLKQS